MSQEPNLSLEQDRVVLQLRVALDRLLAQLNIHLPVRREIDSLLVRTGEHVRHELEIEAYAEKAHLTLNGMECEGIRFLQRKPDDTNQFQTALHFMLKRYALT